MRHLSKILMIICFICFQIKASGPENNGYEIKAAIVYHILHFATWPEKSSISQKKKVVLGILGKNPFGHALDPIRGESIFGKRLEIRDLGASLSPDDISQCHVLYISLAETANLSKILSELQGAGVLTMSDIPNFTDRGGMIGLVNIDNKIRFEINKTVMDRENIKIAAKVLRLAAKIK